MPNTVYDAAFIAFSNGALVGRRRGNLLDKRLATIEEFVNGRRVAWYNNKLLSEYEMHIKQRRNDVIDTFFIRLVDAGRKATRNTLSRTHFATATKIRWPSHDQHLLAAAIEAGNATIYVTEELLGNCAANVRRNFGAKVIRIA
jgi:hypothetical protein